MTPKRIYVLIGPNHKFSLKFHTKVVDTIEEATELKLTYPKAKIYVYEVVDELR